MLIGTSGRLRVFPIFDAMLHDYFAADSYICIYTSISLAYSHGCHIKVLAIVL